MKRISIVMIVKDEPVIDSTIRELFEQIDPGNTECIVVDASMGRLSQVSAKYPKVLWVDFQPRNPSKRITIAEQRNVGVRAAQGEVIVFCDAGGSPEPGWLDAITVPILSGDQILVGGPIRATNLSSLDSWTNLQQDGEEIQYPTTANLALLRTAFDLVGGFNEELDYGSDADFVWRLNSEGIRQICVSKAIMGLDGGSKKRELKRAWRYGKALSDLLLLHPDRRIAKIKSNPEIWIYPTLMLILILALVVREFSKYLIFLFITINFLLLLRNLKSKHPIQILARHYIYGWGFCYQFIRKKIPRFKISPVLIYPADNIRYLEELYKGLKAFGGADSVAAPFPRQSPSNTLNIFLLPFISPLLHLRGAKIIHIHWVYRFKLIWAKGIISGKLVEYWFKFWIRSLKWSGLKIIWTAHNILPHDQIFIDDFETRKYLVRNSETVVALSTEAKAEIEVKFKANLVIVIPEGPLFHPTTFNRTEFRNTLQVSSDNFLLVSLGNLAGYKGIAELIQASRNLEKKVSIRVAGWSGPKEEEELKMLCDLASSAGADIQITFGKLTKNEYGGYLRAADFYVAPFHSITNSGSLNAALTAGLPIVIPDLPSLKWAPKDACVCYQPESDQTSGLEAAINSVVEISDEKMKSMKESAISWASANTWASIGEKHISLYKELIKKSKC